MQHEPDCTKKAMCMFLPFAFSSLHQCNALGRHVEMRWVLFTFTSALQE
jgi:hypothetical protein